MSILSLTSTSNYVASQSMPPNTENRDSRGVNILLHTLRGEHFRHLQNVNNSRAHLSISRNHTIPALSIRLASTQNYTDPLELPPTTRNAARPPWSGPAPPKSWRPTRSNESHNTARWRAKALQPVFSHLDSSDKEKTQEPSKPVVPPLSLLCLQVILASYTNSDNLEFREEIVPYIPDHLRRGLIRHCAVHAPLASWKLEALHGPDGHADGELLVVGANASLKEDHFTSLSNTLTFNSTQQGVNADDTNSHDWNWEEDDHTAQPLHAVLLLSTSLSSTTFLTFPATLTCLALVDTPRTLPIHRLPQLCPLIILLDLSFNLWLADEETEGQKNLERIEWTRWSDLKVVGLRESFVSEDLLQKINKGRWDDIDVIR